MANIESGLGSPLVKTGKTIMLANGKSLAGSAISMIDAFRNLVSLGLSMADASDMCSTRQAEYLGRNDLGRVAPGALASLVVVDQQLALQAVWIEGRRIS